MSTIMDFLDDTYQTEGKAVFLSVDSDETGMYCVLDRTIFYPQGGGQASDTGSIVIGNKTILVTFVKFVDGIVRHYGVFDDVLEEVNTDVTLHVNRDRRLTNALSHTGGHLIQCVIESLIPDLKATKGYHFPDGSYVEFGGLCDIDTVALILEGNSLLENIVNENQKIIKLLVTAEELKLMTPNLPYTLPENKQLRVVRIGEYNPVPCGGTHVQSTGELSGIKITKITRKKGNTKVSYVIG